MNIGKTETMWVVVNVHGDVWENTISYYRKSCIAAFIDIAGLSWGHWRKKYGFRCIKVSVTINEIK